MKHTCGHYEFRKLGFWCRDIEDCGNIVSWRQEINRNLGVKIAENLGHLMENKSI